MFERFTDRARRVLVLAQEEARLLDHNFIGTEHLLLGLVHEDEGVAAKALKALGVSLDDVRQEVRRTLGPSGEEGPVANLPFTPAAKTVLELSMREALTLGHNYIGTEHLLLGLIRHGESGAANALAACGVDLAHAREEVIRTLAGYAGSSPMEGPRPLVAPDTEPLVDPGEGVTEGPVPVEPAALLTWEDVAAVYAEVAAVSKATTVAAQGRGLPYRICNFEPGPLPSVSVAVAAAQVTREAFDEATAGRLTETADPIEGLGDAATYNSMAESVRVLSGSTLFSVSVHGHDDPRAAAIALARKALERLPRLLDT